MKGPKLKAITIWDGDTRAESEKLENAVRSVDPSVRAFDCRPMGEVFADIRRVIERLRGGK